VRLRTWLALTALGAASAAYGSSVALRPPAPPPTKPQPSTWPTTDLTIAYIGHASVLIDFRGTRILTDPAFFERIGVHIGGVTIGPKRLVQAALRPEELPALDAVLVSHAHMDSLDRPSLLGVVAAPLLVVPTRTRDLVDDLGFTRVVELDWGQRVTAGGVTIEAVPVRHWGKRWPWGRWRGYSGYVVTRDDLSVLFASDTAYTDAIGAVGRNHRIDVAILGNGAYDPWIMNHASPEQVWQMFQESRACYLLPVHWDTFRLGKEPVGESMARLLEAAGSERERVVIRRVGETWTMPRAGCARP